MALFEVGKTCDVHMVEYGEDGAEDVTQYPFRRVVKVAMPLVEFEDGWIVNTSAATFSQAFLKDE